MNYLNSFTIILYKNEMKKIKYNLFNISPIKFIICIQVSLKNIILSGLFKNNICL